VPVIFHISEKNFIKITTEDEYSEIDGLMLSEAASSEIFNRNGYIRQLDVYLNPAVE
jgi:hypothetical protein